MIIQWNLCTEFTVLFFFKQKTNAIIADALGICDNGGQL